MLYDKDILMERVKTTSKKYTLDDMNADLRKLGGPKEFPPDVSGVMAVHLLMEGNYTESLVGLLKQENVPRSIKLCICSFFVRGHYSEQGIIVGETLLSIANTSLDEWIATLPGKTVK